MDAAEFQRVYEAFEEFHSFFAPAFGRKQRREHGRHCGPCWCKRRNAENLSESVGVPARSLQRFLTDSRWDDDAVIGRLQEYLAPRLEHPEAVWVLDFRSRAGSPQGWPGSTADDWARWPTARPGCFWPMSAQAALPAGKPECPMCGGGSAGR